VNSFLDIYYGGEEDETKEIHMSKKIVITRSSSKKITSNTQTTSDPPKTNSRTHKTMYLSNLASPNPPKTTPSNQKVIDQTPKPNAPSISPTKLEYDLLEDLKKTKANISLSEIMKLP
jgi:hypothetical protein